MKLAGRSIPRGVAALTVAAMLVAGAGHHATPGRTAASTGIVANDLGPDNMQAKHTS